MVFPVEARAVMGTVLVAHLPGAWQQALNFAVHLVVMLFLVGLKRLICFTHFKIIYPGYFSQRNRDIPPLCAVSRSYKFRTWNPNLHPTLTLWVGPGLCPK
jgi:hypothetical protein